jgi:hypothetical protein
LKGATSFCRRIGNKYRSSLLFIWQKDGNSSTLPPTWTFFEEDTFGSFLRVEYPNGFLIGSILIYLRMHHRNSCTVPPPRHPAFSERKTGFFAHLWGRRAALFLQKRLRDTLGSPREMGDTPTVFSRVEVLVGRSSYQH